jgi:hypothetical protein
MKILFYFVKKEYLQKKLKDFGFKQAVHFESFYLHDHSNKKNNLKQKFITTYTFLKVLIFYGCLRL